eukprot:1151315-Pelagomonas_calceolata.AAC.10
MKIKGPQVTLQASDHPKNGPQLHLRTIFHSHFLSKGEAVKSALLLPPQQQPPHSNPQLKAAPLVAHSHGSAGRWHGCSSGIFLDAAFSTTSLLARDPCARHEWPLLANAQPSLPKPRHHKYITNSSDDRNMDSPYSQFKTTAAVAEVMRNTILLYSGSGCAWTHS